jgi:hypothetical protein
MSSGDYPPTSEERRLAGQAIGGTDAKVLARRRRELARRVLAGLDVGVDAKEVLALEVLKLSKERAAEAYLEFAGYSRCEAKAKLGEFIAEREAEQENTEAAIRAWEKVKQERDEWRNQYLGAERERDELRAVLKEIERKTEGAFEMLRIWTRGYLESSHSVQTMKLRVLEEIDSTERWLDERRADLERGER